MRSAIQGGILAGKADFEIWAAMYGIKINRYHTETCRFYEQPFRSAINNSNQTIIYCGVGSHHQNAIVEINIQIITLGDRKLLLNSKIYWPKAITTLLWPYELKAFSGIFNELKVNDYGITPMKKLSSTTTDITIKNHHTWGCPVYSWMQHNKETYLS